MNHSDFQNLSKGPKLEGWALILGASSGFGEAVSLALAKAGMDIIGVHLDRRARAEHVQTIQDQIRACGKEALFFNANAADETKRQWVLEQVQEKIERSGKKVQTFLHSLAFGTLLPYWSEENKTATIQKKQIDMTHNVMAHSLVYWIQDLLRMKLMGAHGRIFAMTSAGSQVVWKGYGAVSGAKAALEAHIRQLAVELAPLQITANAICAGVTNTPALQKIPGHELMIEAAQARHPYGRLTTPQDVADALVALCTKETRWINGNTIFVDGGEHITG